MSLQNVINRVNEKKAVYDNLPQPRSYTKIWRGINRHPARERNRNHVSWVDYPGRFIPGPFTYWNNRLHTGASNIIRQRSLGVARKFGWPTYSCFNT